MEALRLVTLWPDRATSKQLLDLMQRFNGACGVVARAAIEHDVHDTRTLGRLLSRQLQSDPGGLHSHLATLAIAEAARAYRAAIEVRRQSTAPIALPRFNRYRPVPLDRTTLRLDGLDNVEIAFLPGQDGRIHVPCTVDQLGVSRHAMARGSARLLRMDGSMGFSMDEPETFLLGVGVTLPDRAVGLLQRAPFNFDELVHVSDVATRDRAARHHQR